MFKPMEKPKKEKSFCFIQDSRELL